MTQRLTRTFGAIVAAFLLMGLMGGAGAQNPGGIATAPQLWFKASSVTGVADGVAITTLIDSSGNGHTATPTTTGPVYHASGINGQPYLTFNSSPMTTNTVFSAAYNTSLDFFIVSTVSAAGSGTPAVVFASPSNTFYAGFTTPLLSRATIQCGPSSTIDFPFPSVPSVFSAQYDGVNETIWWNTHPVTGKPLTASLGISGIATVGGGASGGFVYNGNVYEILLYSGLSVADHTAVVSYLTAKYGFVDIAAGTKIVIAHGNSLTAGTNSTGGNDYPTQMATQLNGAGSFAVINYGVPGQTLAQMSNQLPYIDGLSTIPGNKVYICWEGINSILANLTASTAYSQFTALCSGRKAKGYKVIAVTTSADGNFTTAQEAVRQSYNALIRSGWSAYSDSLIDIGADPILGQPTSPSNTTYFSGDLVHFTNLGYSVMAQQATTAARVVVTLTTPTASGQIKRGR